MAATSENIAVNRTGCFSTAEWLVERARQSLKHKDLYEAKSWLLTAKTLYPRDFHVQHEAYNIERNAKKVKESAILFYDMFVQFPNESLLWEDIQNITEALERNEIDPQGVFLKEMFNSLPQDAQREILLQAAGRCKDCIEKCRMMLLLMRRFPDAIPKNGITLTEMLIDAENSEYPTNPLNQYRKLLVNDVLPHLLTSERVVITENWSAETEKEGRQPGISQPTVLKWLELSIQFYSFCATFLPNPVEQQLLSPTASSGPQVKDTREIVSSVQEGRGPWGSLFDIFCLVAKKCEWTEILRTQDMLNPVVHRSIKERWLCISEIHQWLKKAAKHGTTERVINESQEKTGVFYAIIIIFFQSVWEYCKVVNKLDSGVNTSLSSSVPLVLLEDVGADKTSIDGWAGGASSEGSSAPKKKKKKGGTAPSSPSKEDSRAKQTATITVNKSCGNVSTSLPDEFVVSVDTWHILNTHSDYKSGFTRVLAEWHIDQWIWMESFKVDRMVYKAKYKKVVDFLKEQKGFLESDPFAQQEVFIRGSLQMSCCYFYLGEYRNSCAEALNALRFFSSQSINTTDVKSLKRGISTMQGSSNRDTNAMGPSQLIFPGRVLQLIPCTEGEALSFCVRLLITCFKQKISHETRSGDLVGHMIILLQYDWPKEDQTFYELLERIRSHGGLTYRKFFNYIVNIDILEEFAYLSSEGVLKLELLPKSTSTSRSRTVTRGVNKGAKEDFRATLEKQVSRSEENIEVILRTFLEEERDSIINCL
ncbi:integrator complex subunit 10-like [Actinia tenebrosa]|uniref:Integrator complex subunit 10 n=1 Tax=Actinia tenebrosa TaxID=6105 RepID=A0A6P8IIL6_ACTTE|nr:integrator complex subunit 10-like [Actinia tenebrosa]